MENDLQFVTDGNGNRYVIYLEIEDGEKRYYLTKAGVYEKDDDGKVNLASKEINEKYMPLLEEPNIEEYIVERNNEEIEK